MTKPLHVLVLAAGKGTRMKNGRAKVLHPLAGRTLLDHVLAVAGELQPSRVVLVLARGMDEVAGSARAGGLPLSVAIQEPQLGTGHAVQVAVADLPAEGEVLVLYGDTPLIRAETLRALLDARRQNDAAVAVLGMNPPDRTGYGRFLERDGQLVAIVEERHADAELKRTGLCNAGVMVMDGARLPELLAAVPHRPEKNEYYLTDIVELARARGWACVATEGPWQDGVGINSQVQLAEAYRLLQERLRLAALEAGVVMTSPETVHLSADTMIEPGAIIEPYVVVGPKVRIGANAHVQAFSHLADCTVGETADIGPFARIRPGSRIGIGAKVGNFVETKNAQLEPGAKVNHLSYIGDASVGAQANVGAGTITCNYDGFAKHRTEIGAGAFIGSNTALVAPVRIGAGALIGAGSVITADVPADALAVTRAPQSVRPGHAQTLRARFSERKSQGKQE
ncbi:MAG TPA: bifunctional UDP-N-acetylglucosamine diphosphorylase/glucosamine-1-phosphate N-acetyltransferase GlmU [Geminicoccus sp.]|jgi:bifunctional UDP-N-acetylglucosamine pyrophosphorylase/glucosamine-1-phosphate N-acetyltransferase|uniref:bifunctional UDP-N-acetylglucosamine diphosphorylase/glucosamine-1-phosphate N-acetyltransferase GlmU n=1 Tax=Geminicoccus sp. TaxID=2024832 RepID=UPI002E364A2F|nr:bifunctional UDP-N-acetylglucosamine diphosphorylase/glucosamine-1-phosphate N-acetyltransferase GlmU [Geminicoccus sp.]HEX2526416.1 bifunctional UDP-N-acetylglucosamine diphosphorylase/glucosamine-1-phosphate N-acetyltransferase GlmU [Geminicoccus sp.]